MSPFTTIVSVEVDESSRKGAVNTTLTWPNETWTWVPSAAVVEQLARSAVGVQPVHARTSQPSDGCAATVTVDPG